MVLDAEFIYLYKKILFERVICVERVACIVVEEGLYFF